MQEIFMDNTDKAHLPQARKNRAFWQVQFEQWQSSGLPKAAWCRREQLNLARFYYWCRVFERNQGAISDDASQRVQASPAPFLPVTLQHESPVGFQLQVADVTLSCSAPASAEQLQAWLQAIRNSL